MKKKAKLILIRGNSGSGKTSLAKELQKLYNVESLVISQDIVRREMLSACDGPDTPAIPLIYHLLEYGHRHYDVTILEGILFSQWYTPLFEKAFALFDGNIYGYYYDLPIEETIARHNTKAVGSEFGELELRRWWRGTDLLKTISERIFTKDISLADAVKIVCQDIAENSENNPPDILMDTDESSICVHFYAFQSFEAQNGLFTLRLVIHFQEEPKTKWHTSPIKTAMYGDAVVTPFLCLFW